MLYVVFRKVIKIPLNSVLNKRIIKGLIKKYIFFHAGFTIVGKSFKSYG